MRTLIFVSSLLAGVSGCGGTGGLAGPEHGTVVGRVTVSGQPLTEGIIRLVSTDRAVNRLANIGPDGTFEIKAYNGAGLPQGTYRVAVMPGRIPTSNDEDFLSQDSPEAMKSNIPAKYREIDTSDVTIEVKAGENPPHAIELK